MFEKPVLWEFLRVCQDTNGCRADIMNGNVKRLDLVTI